MRGRISSAQAPHQLSLQTIGMIGAHNVLLVAHTEDEETGAIRIISARKATRTERRIYVEGN